MSDSSSDPFSSSPLPPASPPGSTPDPFAGAIPVNLDGPAAPYTPQETEQPQDPEGTAELMVGGVDALCRWLGSSEPPRPVQWELSDRERADLRRDLVPVLRKHGVGDIPYAEEMQLGITLTSIGVPRARRWQAEQAGRVSHDRTVVGQEGRREDGPLAEADTAPTGGASEVSRLLE